MTNIQVRSVDKWLAEAAKARAEVTHRKHGLLTDVRAEGAVGRHLQAPFVREISVEDLVGAWRMRESMSLADAWYVALARRLGATWVTSDARAARRAREHGVRVSVV